MYAPTYLRRWSRGECYVGETFEDYFVVAGQHRDSDVLTRSNFRVALERLGGESETVRVIRLGHWAVGWTEGLLIHESDEAALRVGDEIAAELEDYPILDEENYSELEWDEAGQWWDNCGMRERIRMCAEAGLSIFAARESGIPSDPAGRLYEILTRV
jgi:hypothetical protein